ncbi:MAG: alpha/beta hydrolase [Pseudomonadota bacterium]|nr:alpha/beta hydrolase [Pseudomonadota bacterium]
MRDDQDTGRTRYRPRIRSWHRGEAKQVRGLVDPGARSGRRKSTPAAFRLASTAVWLADQRDRALAIGIPTLVLCGSLDVVTPPALSAEVAIAIPGARLEMIDGAGHLSNLEKPAAFNAALDHFLSEIEQQS